MPMNGFSVGKDVTLNLVTATGPVALSLITGFKSKPETIDVKIRGIDGITRHLVFPDGWTGSLEIERQDSTLDDLWAQFENNYYAGLNNLPNTIIETITEVNGALSQYMYQGVQIKLDDAGDWSGDKSVKQQLSFMAERRIKLA